MQIGLGTYNNAYKAHKFPISKLNITMLTKYLIYNHCGRIAMVEWILLVYTAFPVSFYCFTESKYYIYFKLKKFQNSNCLPCMGSLYETGIVNLHCSKIKSKMKGANKFLWFELEFKYYVMWMFVFTNWGYSLTDIPCGLICYCAR